MEVTITKALKMKSRLVSLSKTTSKNIEKNNSIVEGGVAKADVVEEYSTYLSVQRAIIDIKTAITMGNKLIQSLIYEASELRAEAKMWQEINTDEGITVNDNRWGSNSEPITKVATFNFTGTQSKLKKIQSRLDEIQDVLDNHNHTTIIKLCDSTKELI